MNNKNKSNYYCNLTIKEIRLLLNLLKIRIQKKKKKLKIHTTQVKTTVQTFLRNG